MIVAAPLIFFLCFLGCVEFVDQLLIGVFQFQLGTSLAVAETLSAVCSFGSFVTLMLFNCSQQYYESRGLKYLLRTRKVRPHESWEDAKTEALKIVAAQEAQLVARLCSEAANLIGNTWEGVKTAAQNILASRQSQPATRMLKEAANVIANIPREIERQACRPGQTCFLLVLSDEDFVDFKSFQAKRIGAYYKAGFDYIPVTLEDLREGGQHYFVCKGLQEKNQKLFVQLRRHFIFHGLHLQL